MKELCDLPSRDIMKNLKRMSTEMFDVTEETIIDFISCPICKQYIHPPSVCCEDGHFMCKDCKKEVNKCVTCGSTSFPNKNNTIFDRILREIYYPCANQDSGCSGFFKYTEINEHQSQCPYEKTACKFKESGCYVICKLHEKERHEAICSYGVSCKLLLTATGRVRENCHWRGRKEELQEHVSVCHKFGWSASTLQTNVTFAWMLPIHMDFEKTEFINLDDVNEMFYLHVKCVDEGPQYIAVQYIGGDREMASLYMYTAEFKHGTKQIVFRDNVLPSHIEDVYAHPNCCTFHYDFLRHHFQAERVCDCYIRIYRKGQEEVSGKRQLQFMGTVISEERDGCVSNRESFQDRIEYCLDSMDLPDNPNLL